MKSLYELEKQLQHRFPNWKVTAYDIPDMWEGITVKTQSKEDFDVKIMSNGVMIDHGKGIIEDELNLLVNFLQSLFNQVQPRLI